VEAPGGGGTMGNRRRSRCMTAVDVGGWVGEVIGARAGPKEVSASQLRIRVDWSPTACVVDTAAAFLGPRCYMRR
jgi:hypothetical protein